MGLTFLFGLWAERPDVVSNVEIVFQSRVGYSVSGILLERGITEIRVVTLVKRLAISKSGLGVCCETHHRTTYYTGGSI